MIAPPIGRARGARRGGEPPIGARVGAPAGRRPRERTSRRAAAAWHAPGDARPSVRDLHEAAGRSSLSSSATVSVHAQGPTRRCPGAGRASSVQAHALIRARTSAPRGRGRQAARRAQARRERERLVERLEGQRDPVARPPRGHRDLGAERAAERVAEPLGGLGLVGVHGRGPRVARRGSRSAARGPRARASVSRTVQPSAAAARARRRRSAWSGASSSARPWPSVSVAAREQVERLVGQVEQAQQVRDGDARAADAAADLLAGEAELLDEQRAGARLLDRVEVLAGHVLDQRDLERLRVVVRADERRDRLEARRAARRASGARRRSARRSPPGDRAHQDGLQHAALAQRLGQRDAAPPRRTACAAGAGSGAMSSTGSVAQLGGRRSRALGRRRSRPGSPRGRGPCRASALSHGRPPPWRARSTPPTRRSAGRGG